MAAGSSAADKARERWETENEVVSVGDDVYRYDEAEQDAIREKQPWKNEYALSV